MNHLICHAEPKDWQNGEFEFARADEAPEPGLYLESSQTAGSFISAELTSPIPATEAVLSVNVDTMESPDCALTACVAFKRPAGEWSSWYRVLQWGTDRKSTGVVDDNDGRVEVDLLKVTSPADAWRYRVRWRDPVGAMSIRRVALSLHASSDSLAPELDPPAAIGPLRVPFHSQWDVKRFPPERVCSPTALAMVARFYGVQTTPEATALLAHDDVHDLYGNWAMNVLAASRLGLAAYVDRGDGLSYLRAALERGEPVIASIAYGDAELRGAPVPASKGHLVVVAGFDEHGDVIVRDPAAQGADTWITYHRDQFARAWLEHGGVVYRIAPGNRR